MGNNFNYDMWILVPLSCVKGMMSFSTRWHLFIPTVNIPDK